MIEKNHIYPGDCLKLMEEIPSSSIDLILCDPPYGVLNKKNKDAQWDRLIDMTSLWEHYRRIIHPHGAIILFAQGMFTARLMLSNPSWWRYNLIWDKVRPSGFLNARRRPLRSHEDICVFYPSQPIYHPQMVQCDASQKNHSRGHSLNARNRCYGDFHYDGEEISDYKFPKSIISVPKEHKTGCFYHPSQNPLELMRYLIRTYSETGYTVLDNCMGSGTTCLAAILENRDYIGMELLPEYYEVAEKRISELSERNNPTASCNSPDR